MQIHELNNFTGTLGSGSFLAVDNGTDTGKLSTQQLLAATEARIDNIIAGPAPSAEEIVDARLGADGVTYPSLGDAIRDQFTDVKADLTSEADARIALASRVATAESDIDTLETHKVAQPLDEFNQPTDGTDGQSLRTKGDGTTEWADVGLPTDAQTAQAVSDWLDEHPEATTTVQDHSLTYEKLVNGTLGFVTPEMYGAKGDGVTDDTSAIQNSLNVGLPVLFGNAKIYKVSIASSGGTAISVPNNCIIDLNGSTIQLSANNFGSYNVVKMGNNTIIKNGKVIGNRASNYGSGEHGHIISVFNCENVTIDSIYAAEGMGDGIYVGGNTSATKNLKLNNSTCYHNRRNGLSLVNCENATITNCVFAFTKGTNPQYGVDLETNSASDSLKNIVFENCLFTADNYEGALNIYSHSACSVIVSNCLLYGTVGICPLATNSICKVSNSYIKAGASKSSLAVSCQSGSSVEVTNCTIDCGNNPQSVITQNYDQPCENIHIEDLVVMNGSCGRFTLSWSANAAKNCFLSAYIKDLTITNRLYAFTTSSDLSNRIETHETFIVSDSISGFSCISDVIVIDETSTSTNIGCTYMNNNQVVTVYNKNANSRFLTGPNFVQLDRTETNRLGIFSNSFVKLRWDSLTSKCYVIEQSRIS